LLACSLVAGCDRDDGLEIDEAADVDDASSAAGLSGTADVSFDAVTTSVNGVTCNTESGVVVSPIVSDSFTLTIDGDPVADTWNLQVIQPGEPQLVWTAIEPTVDLDADALTGSAQMQRTDDATITAALAFVVDC
jgi:hypothetical protein